MTTRRAALAAISFAALAAGAFAPAWAQESKGTIRVVQLYPRDMNIYGDWGNALVLQREGNALWVKPDPGPLQRSLVAAMLGNEARRFVGIDSFDFRDATLDGVERNLAAAGETVVVGQG